MFDRSRTHRSDRGFTLVEILIAIVLVGILSAVVVVGVGSLTSKGSSAACEASADAARAAVAVRMVSDATPLTRIDQLTTSGAMSMPAGSTVSSDGLSLSTANWTLQVAPGVSPTFRCLPLLTAGLQQTNFNDTTLTAQVSSSTYTGAASVDFGAGGATGTGIDNFSVRYTGSITFPTSGAYTLVGAADDVIRVKLNGVQVLSGGGSVVIPTVAGTYPIEIEFVENGGGANWSLSWIVPGASSAVTVPATAFSTTAVPSVAVTQAPTASVLSSVADAVLLKIDGAQAPAASATATCTAAGQPTRTGTGSPSPIGVGGLTSGVTYSCTVAVGSSAASTAISVTPGAGPAVAGLVQRAYSDTTLTTLALVSLNTTQARAVWGALGPTASLVDNFSVRYTGAITLPTTGSYTFASAADDVIRVWLDGVQILPTAGTVTLTASAGSHPIQIEFVEVGGGASWSLTWLTPGSGTAVYVPATAFTTL